jgi:hypothetical protein
MKDLHTFVYGKACVFKFFFSLNETYIPVIQTLWIYFSLSKGHLTCWV